jgi:hypothetical protein
MVDSILKAVFYGRSKEIGGRNERKVYNTVARQLYAKCQ